MAETMSKLLKAMGCDGDRSISDRERDTFLQMLNAAADLAGERVGTMLSVAA